jgi:hypothetical protein
MKPNQLVIEAFGPYATRAEVDFDALADTRLFVVSGPTGAGKTSIFDAMCWALYGELPGNRLREGKVRSDAADPRPPHLGIAHLYRRRHRLSGGASAGTGTTKAAGHRQHHREAVGRVAPAGGRRLGANGAPVGRDQSHLRRPGRPDPRPVPAGGAAPPGSLPGGAARLLGRTNQVAAHAVRHRRLRARPRAAGPTGQDRRDATQLDDR